jgi:DNA-directed RNA polymerase alpha subunit
MKSLSLCAKMLTKILAIEGNTCTFSLNRCELHVANLLRRVIISEIPSMAVNSVTIERNSSFLSDELLVHRFGLIPIMSEDVDKFNAPDACTCLNTCTKCSIKFVLDVDCVDRSLIVWTDCLKNMDNNSLVPLNIVINKMKRGQGLRVIARVCKGIARVHSKWSVVSSVGFSYKSCKISGQQEKKLYDFVFVFVSIGTMSVELILSKALKILRDKIEKNEQKSVNLL